MSSQHPEDGPGRTPDGSVDAADAAQQDGADLLATATDADDEAARPEPRDVEGDLA